MIFVPQRGLHDCATACCSMVLRYFGRLHDYQSIDKLLRPRKEKKTSILQMMACLRNYSLEAYGMKGETSSILAKNEIAIYHMKSGKSHHFVVLKAQKRRGFIKIYDPRFLWVTLRTTRYFRKYWTGYYLKVNGQKSTNKIPIELKIPFFIKAFLIGGIWVTFVLILLQALMQV